MTAPMENVVAVESTLVLTELDGGSRFVVGDVATAVGEVDNAAFG